MWNQIPHRIILYVILPVKTRYVAHETSAKIEKRRARRNDDHPCLALSGQYMGDGQDCEETVVPTFGLPDFGEFEDASTARALKRVVAKTLFVLEGGG